ncbi:DUF3826 domain-containing protein [Filimonas effusa]|uniref:DUF3826 domain-containing protein n=1 Tax=Filimonas effusa TaxID=2508721 RepID=A0A4V1MAQ8_9BACT|nr:DUF3826 domain-containing protein [Filimonas effusa]RXK86726.1 DUF3826 domain-containing protein [Filimonas effusa]
MQRLFSAFCLLILAAFFSPLIAQQNPDTAFQRVIQERAAKVVAPLAIKNVAKSARVTKVVAQQYLQLSAIQEERDAAVKAAKASGGTKQGIDSQLKVITTAAEVRVNKLHKQYLANLSADLTTSQIETIKNGMTYNVLPNTYAAYQDMLPDLTKEQKAQILTWLTEAREYAMDAESSKAKHAWFGKYKGRINNYLSAAGIDMKKAGEEWQARIKARNNSK